MAPGPSASVSTHDVLVVGAGLAGLTAARELAAAGRRVLVVDKGRGVGGRLATRRIGAATLDHGAQFFTARDPRFAAQVERWRAAGVVRAWFQRPLPLRTAWRGEGGMTALAKDLAGGLDVRLGTRLTSLGRSSDGDGWTATLEGGAELHADEVVLTAPVPQALELLGAGGFEPEPIDAAALAAITYAPCIAALAVLEGPAMLPSPGCLELNEGDVAWLADNQLKGISARPAVTLHGTAAFSRAHWDQAPQDAGRELLMQAQSWVGARVAELQVHRWRFARPVVCDVQPCRVLSREPRLVLAGDAFVGPRVEAAALSGLAAAAALLE